MEPDIPPKPYRHPNESLKTLWVVLVVVTIPDLLHSEWPMNIWLAESIGLACCLPVVAFVPPRMGLRRVALLYAAMCLIVAVQYLAHLYFHLHR
jgi:hypothetical protein